jgi:NDP-sugar pyrophosphorylase family protein
MTDVGAVILAGGEGSRLGPLGKLMPKCLLPLNDGTSLLLRLLGQLAKAGVCNVVIASNASNHHQIQEHSEAHGTCPELRGMSVNSIVCEKTPLGPLPALGEAALSLATQTILMCLGDIFFFRSPFTRLFDRLKAEQEFDGYVIAGRDEVSADDGGTGWIACAGQRVKAISYPPFPNTAGGTEIVRWSGAFAFSARMAESLRNEFERFSRTPLEHWVQSLVRRDSKIGWLDAGAFANVNSSREYELLLSRTSGNDLP